MSCTLLDSDVAAEDLLLLCRLIAHANTRFSSMAQVTSHPFFKSAKPSIKWDDLRATRAPFVPALDSEIDTGYYDDFTSVEDMAKYAEVLEKQKNVNKVKEKEEPFARGVWVGFTFRKNGPMAMAGGRHIGSEDDGSKATIF